MKIVNPATAPRPAVAAKFMAATLLAPARGGFPHPRKTWP
jgi:hypothetical protein